MKNKLLILALAAATMLIGCKKYDDTDVRNDIKDLQNRVTALETWCETAKGQIGSLQGLVTALESKNFITGVTPILEGAEEVGYTITFQTGNPITIKHGKDGQNGDPGATPQIGASKDPENPSDETYYWTVKIGDGEPDFILDEQDNKIPVTGEKGDTPELSVEEDGGVLYWKVDGEWLLDGTDKVPATGEQGDAIFQKDGIDYESDPDNVIFTLANGTTLTVPRTRTLTVGFDSYEVFMLTPTSNVIDIVLPETLKEEDYTALVAEVKNEAGTGMAIATRAASMPWQVELTKPSFVDGVYQNDAKATVTATGANNGDRAILKITLIDAKGQEISVSRVLEYFNGVIVDVQAGGLSAALDGIAPTDITGLKVLGTLDGDDFTYIRENLTALETLDLSGSDITELPAKALGKHWSNTNLNANTSVKKVILPEGLLKIKDYAFAGCTNLEEVNIPSTVTVLGSSILQVTKVTSVTIPSGVKTLSACFDCTAITDITIPNTVTSLSGGVFEANATTYKSWGFENAYKDEMKERIYKNLKSVTFEEGSTITTIPDYCFYDQQALTSIILPNSVTSIGKWAFRRCLGLTSVTLSSGLQKIGELAFCMCQSIKEIDIPASVTNIASGAFKWIDYGLDEVICRAEDVPISGSDIFTIDKNVTGAPATGKHKVLKVPANSVEAYKTAWGAYFEDVVAIE